MQVGLAGRVQLDWAQGQLRERADGTTRAPEADSAPNSRSRRAKARGDLGGQQREETRRLLRGARRLVAQVGALASKKRPKVLDLFALGNFEHPWRVWQHHRRRGGHVQGESRRRTALERIRFSTYPYDNGITTAAEEGTRAECGCFEAWLEYEAARRVERGRNRLDLQQAHVSLSRAAHLEEGAHPLGLSDARSKRYRRCRRRRRARDIGSRCPCRHRCRCRRFVRAFRCRP
mmetsp:Transcript_8557/g.21858  ORF Transcript_8557/g.21858 Transcript_8557/m.21858 type:complete len:233 (-) Transcript_8557:810-1508(-)